MAKKPKKKIALDDETFSARAEKLKERLLAESDRGKVLLCGTLLDEEIEVLLRAHMRKLPKELDKDIFSGFGPLSTFSGKTKLSYALKLLDEDLYRDLNIIKEIRNHLAHAYDSDSPYDEWISEKAKELKYGSTEDARISDYCSRLCIREETKSEDETLFVSPVSTSSVLIATFQIVRIIRAKIRNNITR